MPEQTRQQCCRARRTAEEARAAQARNTAAHHDARAAAVISAGVPQWVVHTQEYLPKPVARDYFIVSEMQGREQVHWHALISAGVPQWVMQRAAGRAPAGPVAWDPLEYH